MDQQAELIRLNAQLDEACHKEDTAFHQAKYGGTREREAHARVLAHVSHLIDRIEKLEKEEPVHAKV